MGANYLTAQAIADGLGISVDKFRRQMLEGKLPYRKVRCGHYVVYEPITNTNKECAMNQNEQPQAGPKGPKPTVVDEDGQVVEDLSQFMNQQRPVASMTKLQDSILELASKARQYAQAYNDLRRHSLEITLPGDWLIQGQQGVEDPEVYLEAPGARRLAHAWGILIDDRNLHQERQVQTDSFGEYYLVLTTGTISFLGRTMPEIGIATSRDSFFSKKDGTTLASEDVSVANVYKKSFTDFVRRGVTHMLGLEAMPLSELPEAYRAKIKAQRVDYGKGTKGGKMQTPEERTAANNIWSACMKMAGGKTDVAGELLWSLTKWKGKKGDWMGSRTAEDLQRLAGQSMQITYERVKKAWKDWEAGGSTPYIMDDLKAEEALSSESTSSAAPSDDQPFGG